jgi:2-keto-4-pentenoate hydratase/2-oxohepta-3-ene-1,7-dioic acid hydratase in catechol pathway
VKLVLFVDPSSAETRPGLLTERGIVDVSNVVPLGHTPQLTMQYIIDRFDDLRADLQRLVTDGQAVSIDTLRLRPPLPRPGKILACIANYWEHAQREARPLNMFMKNPDAVIGPDETIELPNFTEPSSFMHEAELALVIKGPAKSVAREHWRAAVFGYTCMIDVSARGEGRYTWPKGPPASWPMHCHR